VPPAKPIKESSLSSHGNKVVAASANPIRDGEPMQANWNASLQPEAVGNNPLQSTSFEERASEAGNPLRRAMEGYCPVQLQENDRWVAGNPKYRLAYQGQVFVFSSDSARKRFEAAPEKYAPMQSGNDVVLAMEENRTVPGSVAHSATWHGRVYLFSNSATLAAFQEDPARYATATRQAPLRVPADSL
jgi:YHS domain-containing protein